MELLSESWEMKTSVIKKKIRNHQRNGSSEGRLSGSGDKVNN